MKQEILEKIKNEYLVKCEEIDNIKNIKSRIKELEKDKHVIEYLNLTSKLEDSNTKTISKNQILSSIFTSYVRREIDETNEILVYLGTYMSSCETDIEHGASDIRVNKNDVNAEFSLYADLEKDLMDSITVPIKDRDDFEKKHQIIYPKGIRNERRFYELQQEFIVTAINEGQERAVNKILQNITKN